MQLKQHHQDSLLVRVRLYRSVTLAHKGHKCVDLLQCDCSFSKTEFHFTFFFYCLLVHSQSTTLGTFSHEISRQSMAYIQRNRGQLDTCIPLLLSTLLSKRTRRVSHSMTILNDPQFGCFPK